MDHPLRSKENKNLRSKVVQLLQEGFNIRRQSNIVFVCGGNDPVKHMRKKFQGVFPDILPDHEFFEPEFAMKNYFTLGDVIPFDISDFEELVGQLSHSIVLFPEAPGSLAETGYFSARPDLARKIILAIDVKRQKADSFISLGPAKKIQDVSRFQPNIQFDYENPDFEVIAQRMNEREPLNKNKRAFTIKEFSKTEPFELFSLVHQIVLLLRIATADDIEFFLKSLYKNHLSVSKSKKIISILVGSKRLNEVGEFGHLVADEEKPPFLTLKDGAKTAHSVISVDLSTAFLSADGEFLKVLEGA